jgi:DNA processing protein
MNKLMLNSSLSSKISRIKNCGELFFIGEDPHIFSDKTWIAVVGTRKPTSYGKHIVSSFMKEFSRYDICIVSGLAIGIDELAHKAALENNLPTIAVLPSGLEAIYPVTNRPLATQIIQQHGSLISEYSAQHKPRKKEFLERNRIIASLSDAVLIPEAAERSGSLNTAGHALRADIPLFTVPGSIQSPMSAGSNQLLSTKTAQAVLSGSQLLSNLGIHHTTATQTAALKGSNDIETAILEQIISGNNDNHTLLEKLSIENSELQTHLSMLEIDGRIAPDESGNWTLL